MARVQVHELGYDFAPGSSALKSWAGHVPRAVVFIHGFGGHPHKTWVHFQSLCHQGAWWDGADLYFFNYRSVRDHIQDSSMRLKRFVESIAQEPRQLPVDRYRRSF